MTAGAIDTRVVKTRELQLDDRNANLGTDRGRGMLDKSLRDHRAGRSILVDRNGKVIAGNKTLQSAAGVGIEEIIVVPTDGSRLVAVQRTDLDLDTDADARALAYADNRVAELDLAWDIEQLMRDLESGVQLDGYFYDDEVARLIEGIIEDEKGDKAKKAGGDTAPAMALQPFEHYDYVMLVFRNQMDWTKAVSFLGIDRAAFDIGKGRRKVGMCRVIDGARAIDKWESGSSFQARAE